MKEEINDQLDTQYSDDESHIPAAHSKLLGAVSELYEKKRVKAPTRKEPSLEVSEFHLSQPGKKRSSHVKVTDLAKALNKRATHVEISQKLKTAQKRAKTLPKPLEKIHADKISRAAGYEHAKQQLNRWDAIVYKQRVAEQLQFPLKTETVKIHDSTDILKMFRIPTELEIKLAEEMKQPNPLEKQIEENRDKTEEREEDYPLSLGEVIEKRKMMAKLRAQQSYRQAKAARHSKIKSKKFHQIQRRTRVKEQLREFEELQKKDPEAALKKLEELERTRAEERVSLRHRSTGQWAKNLAVRAKYDKEARIALAEQLSKSRELTVKLAQNKDSESEKEDEEEAQPEPIEEDPSNPWVVKQSKEMGEFLSGYRKFWTAKELKSNSSTDTSVLVMNVKVVDKETSDKENSEPKPENESREKPDRYNKCLNKDGEEVLNLSSDSVSKNVFTVNDASEQNINSKTNNTTLLKFNITSSPLTKKNIVQNITDNWKISPLSIARSTNLRARSRTGSWIITRASDNNNKMSKHSKRVKYQEPKKHFGLSSSFEITDSKVTNSLKSVTTKSKGKEIKISSIQTENAEERMQKVKSLDEMFEDVEDKLQRRIKERYNSLKRKLSNKRKVDDINSDSESETEEIPSLELKKSKISADVDEELLEQVRNIDEGSIKRSNHVTSIQAIASSEIKSADNIDPNKFLKVAPRHLSSKIPEIMTEGDALDDEKTVAENRHLTISEAFAEDDVVDQFQKEKEEEVKKSNIGDIDLSLPGWGSWAGHNMKALSRRKRKKFVIKFPKAIPRRDTNRGNVIINEDADKPLKEHQVSEIPFPFTSVREYEASIRAPLGSTWVPQTAHQKLTLPPVVTRQGAVIEPMDESQLINQDKQLATKKVKMNKKHNRKSNKK